MVKFLPYCNDKDLDMIKAKISALNLFTYLGKLPGRIRNSLRATSEFNFPPRLLEAGKSKNLPVAIDYYSPHNANLYLASADILDRDVDFILLSGESPKEIGHKGGWMIFKEFKLDNQIFSNFVANIADFYAIEPLKNNHEANPIIQPPLSSRNIPRLKITFKSVPEEYEPEGKLGVKRGYLKQSEIEYKKWLQIELLILIHRPPGYPIESLVNDCEAIANRLVRVHEGELNLLIAQNLLSEEDLVLLREKSKDFNVAALSFKISQMLQEYLDNDLSRPQIEVLIRRLSPLVRPKSLAERFDVSFSVAVTAIWASKNPAEYLKNKKD